MLSASCTTGWLDWIHGELWLLPNGLLRVRRGLGATVAGTSHRTVPEEAIRRNFMPDEIESLRLAHRTNLWIPSDSIVSAKISNGPLSGRLSLQLRDGRRLKLLWLRADQASEPLKRALRSWRVSAS